MGVRGTADRQRGVSCAAAPDSTARCATQPAHLFATTAPAATTPTPTRPPAYKLRMWVRWEWCRGLLCCAARQQNTMPAVRGGGPRLTQYTASQREKNRAQRAVEACPPRGQSQIQGGWNVKKAAINADSPKTKMKCAGDTAGLHSVQGNLAAGDAGGSAPAGASLLCVISCCCSCRHFISPVRDTWPDPETALR